MVSLRGAWGGFDRLIIMPRSAWIDALLTGHKCIWGLGMGVEHSDIHRLDHRLLGGGLGPNLNRLSARSIQHTQWIQRSKPNMKKMAYLIDFCGLSDEI